MVLECNLSSPNEFLFFLSLRFLTEVLFLAEYPPRPVQEHLFSSYLESLCKKAFKTNPKQKPAKSVPSRQRLLVLDESHALRMDRS